MLNRLEETKTRPSAVECKDALNACMQCLGMFYCIQGAERSADPEDRNGALDLAVGHLHKNLQTVRDHFGMDNEEAAS